MLKVTQLQIQCPSKSPFSCIYKSANVTLTPKLKEGVAYFYLFRFYNPINEALGYKFDLVNSAHNIHQTKYIKFKKTMTTLKDTYTNIAKEQSGILKPIFK